MFQILISVNNENNYNPDNFSVPSYFPEKGLIPDEKTAIKIAKVIWRPIYGIRIYRKRPFKARLTEDKKFWIVYGTLKKNEIGGVPYLKINKNNCEVVEIHFTK